MKKKKKKAAHFGPDVRVRGSACPGCGANLTGASGVSVDGPVTQPVPKPDDVTICLYCGALLVFNADLTARYPTPAEEAEILATLPHVADMLAAQAVASGKKPS